MHQLKGSAGVVGANRLAFEAAAVERELRPGTVDTAVRGRSVRLASLGQVLGTFLAALAEDQAPPPSQRVESGAPEQSPGEHGAICLEALRPIKRLLEDADMSAIDAFDDWLEQHPDAHAQRYQRLRARMECMDLQAAADECDRLLLLTEDVDLEIE